MKQALLALLIAVGAGNLAFAAPASIADCESIKGVDAYNYCLASFGPRRGAHPSGDARRQVAHSSIRKVGGNAPSSRRAASGRISMSFDVGSHRKPRH